MYGSPPHTIGTLLIRSVGGGGGVRDQRHARGVAHTTNGVYVPVRGRAEDSVGRKAKCALSTSYTRKTNRAPSAVSFRLLYVYYYSVPSESSSEYTPRYGRPFSTAPEDAYTEFRWPRVSSRNLDRRNATGRRFGAVGRASRTDGKRRHTTRSTRSAQSWPEKLG